MDEVSVVLKKTKVCSRVVRYDHPENDDKICRNVYIGKEAFKGAEPPESIKLTISAG